MKKAKYTTVVALFGVLLVVGSLGIWMLNKTKRVSPASNFEECVGLGGMVMESYPRQCAFKGLSFTEVLSQRPGMAMEPVTLDVFGVGDQVSSPLKISGKALGSWYFEGQFIIAVVSESGEELGQGTAKALGEWMQTGYVPFQAEVKFDKQSAQEGYIEFRKDNPSGLPENDSKIRVPVKFR